MRVFIAGASGVVGRHLIPLLVDAGHHVTATTRSAPKLEGLRAMGTEPILVDAFEQGALDKAVREAAPEVVIDQLTAVPRSLLRPISALRGLASTDRLRSDVTPQLVASARSAGARRLIAQSVAFAYQPGPGARTETDPLFVGATGQHGRSVRAVATLERNVSEAQDLEGVVLRYGALTGPGTLYAPDGGFIDLIRRKLLPIVDGGHGVYGFVDAHDAARATMAAITGPPGTFNIVDDEPVEAETWIPAVADGRQTPPSHSVLATSRRPSYEPLLPPRPPAAGLQ